MPFRSPGSPHAPAGAVPLARAIGDNASLAALLARVAESKRRFEAIVHLLPAGLRSELQPGPLDETRWTLLARNAAAAAKVRQLVPVLETALTAAGWHAPPLKVQLLPRRPP